MVPILGRHESHSVAESVAGVLLAATGDIRSDDEFFIEGVDLRGAIGSADAAAQTFSLRDSVVFHGAQTRFEGGAASDLAAGRQARVHGIVNPDRTRVVATRIEFVNNIGSDMTLGTQWQSFTTRCGWLRQPGWRR